jgi:hypothetical protein
MFLTCIFTEFGIESLNTEEEEIVYPFGLWKGKN